jgi:hypothetical protein
VKRSVWRLTPVALVLACGAAISAPSVYPTGTTVYDPELAWSGYTVLSPLGERAVLVIDMNGNVVKRWEDYNVAAGGPARILPGGVVVAANGARPPHQESLELVQRDFDGHVMWRIDHNEQIETDEGTTIWSLRQHHDWQRFDFPAGYYSPEVEPSTSGGRTLVLTHTNHTNENVADVLLEDDRLIEVSWDGEIVWEWVASDHIDELGFDAHARAAIRAAPGFSRPRGSLDWLHINSATYVGPNRWYDDGDERFAPGNVLISSRQASVVAIVDHDDGSIAWRLGPDYRESEETQAIRQVIGQHHVHLIPKGLPGAGNVMIFDNGGSSGYGQPSAIAPDGLGIHARSNSRILEIDPVSLELVWSYSRPGQFFSSNISSAQRLPNGNTLITEGASGRLFEVTGEDEIVWEYMHPVFTGPGGRNAIYRGYRLPYAWIPQLEAPIEVAVEAPALGEFRVR